MSNLRLCGSLVLIALAFFQENAASFLIQPTTTHRIGTRYHPSAMQQRQQHRLVERLSAEPTSADNSGEEEDSLKSPVTPPAAAPRPPKRTLDPLIASLTRMDADTENAKTVSAPVFGEIPLDGGLVVLIPAIVIGVVGFVMSLVVIANSQDAIVDSLTQLSDDVNSAAVARTNSVPLNGDECRGLCSSQETDLQNLKVFMEGLGGGGK